MKTREEPEFLWEYPFSVISLMELIRNKDPELYYLIKNSILNLNERLEKLEKKRKK